jgi:hypothetical protein
MAGRFYAGPEWPRFPGGSAIRGVRGRISGRHSRCYNPLVFSDQDEGNAAAQLRKKSRGAGCGLCRL